MGLKVFGHGKLCGTSFNNEPRYLKNFITGYLLNQILVKAAIREYNEKAVSVLIAEFLQLDKRETFIALDPIKLTKR